MSNHLQKVISWVCYNYNRKPTEGISDARWNAMYRHIMREYL
jgi:hypothetical protein